MEIIIYSQQGCSNCEHMKELCNRANVSYKEVLVDVDIPKHVFTKEFPQATGFPFVIIDDKRIGGLVEAAKYFIQEGLVSAKRK